MSVFSLIKPLLIVQINFDKNKNVAMNEGFQKIPIPCQSVNQFGGEVTRNDARILFITRLDLKCYAIYFDLDEAIHAY